MIIIMYSEQFSISEIRGQLRTCFFLACGYHVNLVYECVRVLKLILKCVGVKRLVGGLVSCE